jgi:hypothetical protein
MQVSSLVAFIQKNAVTPFELKPDKVQQTWI